MKLTVYQIKWAAVALPLLLLGAHRSWADSPAPAESPESVRALLVKWSETQQILSKEREEWKQGKEVLISRVDLLKGEVAALEGKGSEASKGTLDIRRERQELLNQADLLKSSAEELAKLAGEMEGRIRSLQARLPDPLKEKIGPLYSRMPAEGAHSAASPAERFQNIAGILNEINKFNGEITVTSEIRTLSDGKPAEVRVVYLGLGQAYFVGSQGQAGIGRPSTAGWEWQTDDTIAPRVQEVVEILQSKAKPKFVALPVDLR
jgi:uncharacterized protein DUF3450